MSGAQQASTPTAITTPVIRRLGCVDYESTWRAMQAFTESRSADTPDEIWLLEHPPVYTLGLNGKPEHVLAAGDVPLVKVDRGGQVTYHGPGQLILYPLLDIRRRGLGVRRLVTLLEQSVVRLLAGYRLHAYPRADAPGVYVEQAKIAALGLRVRRGASYHGLSLNVDMDLEPFSRINPCGHAGMAVTQLSALHESPAMATVSEQLLAVLMELLADNGNALMQQLAAETD